jgi:3-deoxy-7-phosphoheptulonate synthase
MLIVMDRLSPPIDVENVERAVRDLGLASHRIPGAARVSIGVTGDTCGIPTDRFRGLPGVVDVIRITKPYKLVSREMQPEDTVVEVRGHRIGGPHFGFIAGPCAVESREQLLAVAERVASLGIPFLRGGAVKPRTSPYTFQGLGTAGFRILREASERYDLAIVSEVLDCETVDRAADCVDVFQVGARSMQNYPLLRHLADVGKPVLLKRGASATLEDLLMSAEHILSRGNRNVILCERGIRTFSSFQRHTFDVAILPEIRKVSHLPIIADPSHASGKREMVPALALAAVAAGASGIMIEAHPDPAAALSDGPQALALDELTRLHGEILGLLHHLRGTAERVRDAIGSKRT